MPAPKKVIPQIYFAVPITSAKFSLQVPALHTETNYHDPKDTKKQNEPGMQFVFVPLPRRLDLTITIGEDVTGCNCGCYILVVRCVRVDIVLHIEQVDVKPTLQDS